MSAAPAREGEARGDLPRRFGEYLLFDHIGRGGMADIFLAQVTTSLGGSRLAVVKQVLPKLAADQEFAEMLTAEAKLAAQLNHTNIVSVFDLGREGERLFIAMEYVEGFDLNQLLRQLSRARVALPAEFAIFIVREVLQGLDYAHRAKDEEGRGIHVVHRDVSPSNVLISFEGEVKLCDFGIARAMEGASGPSEDTVQKTRVVGKSAYMSPEHARGEKIDGRADVFAAGILLWELMAGRRMYRGTEDAMLRQAREGAVPDLPDRGMPEHDRLAAVLQKALAPTREERWETAQDMLDALTDYAIDTQLMASQLRFGSFLTEQFADEIVRQRREHERVAAELEQAGEVVDTSTASIDSRTTTPYIEREPVDFESVFDPPTEPRDTTGTRRKQSQTEARDDDETRVVKRESSPDEVEDAAEDNSEDAPKSKGKQGRKAKKRAKNSAKARAKDAAPASDDASKDDASEDDGAEAASESKSTATSEPPKGNDDKPEPEVAKEASREDSRSAELPASTEGGVSLSWIAVFTILAVAAFLGWYFLS